MFNIIFANFVYVSSIHIYTYTYTCVYPHIHMYVYGKKYIFSCLNILNQNANIMSFKTCVLQHASRKYGYYLK